MPNPFLCDKCNCDIPAKDYKRNVVITYEKDRVPKNRTFYFCNACMAVFFFFIKAKK